MNGEFSDAKNKPEYDDGYPWISSKTAANPQRFPKILPIVVSDPHLGGSDPAEKVVYGHIGHCGHSWVIPEGEPSSAFHCRGKKVNTGRMRRRMGHVTQTLAVEEGRYKKHRDEETHKNSTHGKEGSCTGAFIGL